MTRVFKAVVNGATFLLKRMYHPDVPLTYHVHFQHIYQKIVFRIGQLKDKGWYLFPQQLPKVVHTAVPDLIAVIEMEESDGVITDSSTIKVC